MHAQRVEKMPLKHSTKKVGDFYRCDFIHFDAELLNVSIRRIRLFSRILLNKKNRRKFNL